MWVIGGFSYTNIYRSVFSWDGRNFQRKAPISQDRAWATATVYPSAPAPAPPAASARHAAPQPRREPTAPRRA